MSHIQCFYCPHLSTADHALFVLAHKSKAYSVKIFRHTCYHLHFQGTEKFWSRNQTPFHRLHNRAFSFPIGRHHEIRMSVHVLASVVLAQVEVWLKPLWAQRKATWLYQPVDMTLHGQGRACDPASTRVLAQARLITAACIGGARQGAAMTATSLPSLTTSLTSSSNKMDSRTYRK